MFDLSEKLSEDFLVMAGTLKELKDTSKEIVETFKKFNKSVDEPNYKINEDIFTCLNSTFSSWCGQAHNQSRIVSRFLQKTFSYTSKEIQALNEVKKFRRKILKLFLADKDKK